MSFISIFVYLFIIIIYLLLIMYVLLCGYLCTFILFIKYSNIKFLAFGCFQYKTSKIPPALSSSTKYSTASFQIGHELNHSPLQACFKESVLLWNAFHIKSLGRLDWDCESSGLDSSQIRGPWCFVEGWLDIPLAMTAHDWHDESLMLHILSTDDITAWWCQAQCWRAGHRCLCAPPAIESCLDWALPSVRWWSSVALHLT